MNVLSLFDGISCGRVALERVGIHVDNYFACEIDKYAIQISQKNWPDIIHLGDVRQVNGYDLPEIDLLIGGSPCQDLSIAKRNRKGLDGDRSGLFYEYVRILNEVKPKYFILENVASMPKEAKEIITSILGVEPIIINSALVSAQNRNRLYWSNIQGITQPEDKKIFLKDILEDMPFRDLKPFCFIKNSWGMSGMKTITTEKSNNLTTKNTHNKMYLLNEDKTKMRTKTPLEYERLQTLPEGYTEGVSNNQRYKCVGNGWTVDVIAHILSFIQLQTNSEVA